MNDFIEKKWFIFVKDKHEGPYTIDEVHDKILHLTIPTDTYVWKEGMSDWKLTSALPEFQSPFFKTKLSQNIAISVNNVNPETEGGFVAAEAYNSSEKIESNFRPIQTEANPSGDALATPVMEGNAKNDPTPEDDFFSPFPEKSTVEPILESKISAPLIEKSALPLPRHFNAKKLLALFIPLAILSFMTFQAFFPQTSTGEPSDFKQSLLLNLAEKIPLLGSWISPIPAFDVSEEEYEELKSAAKAKLEFTGPKFALGLSRKDLLFPELILASNLPNGTKFKIHIIGNPSTLLNLLSFERELEITLNKKISRTGPIHFQDGKPIPRGEYIVSISAEQSQAQNLKNLMTSSALVSSNLPAEVPKDTKILAFKTYFLGGPRDAVYGARLKEFHDRLRDRATKEINELKQFATTLESQLEATSSKFSELKEGRSRPKQKRQWAEFHQEWSKLESSLNGIFDNWTPSVIQDQFFYGSLYLLVHQLAQSIDRVHSFQNSFFVSTQDLKTLQIQVGETAAAAQGTLILVKSKLDQAEKMPPTANGMPRTEGL